MRSHRPAFFFGLPVVLLACGDSGGVEPEPEPEPPAMEVAPAPASPTTPEV